MSVSLNLISTSYKTYLVYNHDREQIQQRRDEQPVHVMLHSIAHHLAKHIQNDLPDREAEHTKGNMEQRPSLLQRPHHQKDLHDHVHSQEDRAENVDHNEQPDRVVRTEPRPALEREERDRKRHDEGQETGDPEQPDGERGAIFVELEADEAIDHQTYGCRGCEAEAGGDEVGVCAARGWNDAAVDDEGGECEERVGVEECGDFFATCKRCS